jgi:type VI secretion system protein ImpM
VNRNPNRTAGRAGQRPPAASRIGYFGKIPAHSDFIKLADDQPVMGMLDDWIAQVMTRLPADARWKLNYDALAPASFAFVGPDRRHAVAGHLVASHDRSGRRFPFLMMCTVEVPDPGAFVARSPLAFGPFWDYLEGMAPRVLVSSDPSAYLQAIAETPVFLGGDDATPDGMPEGGADSAPDNALERTLDRAFDRYLALSTVGELTARLHLAANRLILGLGLLLQPVMHSRPASLHKSLVLPLPRDGAARHATAAFWLELLLPFIRRSGFDLALFLTRVRERPALVVGFGGAAVGTLHALIDPLVAADQQVHLEDNAWIDEQVGLDVDVRALASYLEQPALPLRLARELFLNTFIGAAS